MGYTNRSFPTAYQISDGDVKEVLYYDDYGFNNNDANYTFKNAPNQAFHAQGLSKGLLTGKLLRNVKTSTWQKMVMYYDYRGKIIQDFHFTNKSNLIRKDYQYSFNDELLKTRITKGNNTKFLTYLLDHVGRKVSFTYNGKSIAKYEYDVIGRLNAKKFSPSGTTQGTKQTGNWTDESSWLSGILPNSADNVTINSGHVLTVPSGQIAGAGTLNDRGTLRNFGTLNMGKYNTADLYTQTFSYHIRNTLRGINLDANGNLTNTLFSYKLEYEGNNGFFDGNIRNQYWKSSIDGIQRAYEFSYDGDSRIIQANYGSNKAGESYALNAVTYDGNGNIKTLSRNGATNTNYTSFGNVDNLTYTYATNSNKLAKIADATTTNTDLGDFRDGTNTGDDYEYWEDGSLKKDRNKGIDSLNYNYLKLTERIKFTSGRAINYEYDANGTKLKKIDSNGETTDYEEDEIYVNGNLYQTSHDEGRIANGIFEYNITDHNNDLRVAFKDSLGIAVPTQSIFYDPWGLSMKGMQITRNSLNFNKFQFLNRETQFETGYIDLNRRMFDPPTGRFIIQDPVTDGQEHLSLYQYGWNNPILRPDPNGDCPHCGDLFAFTKGFNSAVIEDFSILPISVVNTQKGGAYAKGVTAGHVSAIVLGAIETAIGAGGDGLAAIGEVITGGAATPAALPVAVASTGAIVHGVSTVSKGVSNLRSEGSKSDKVHGNDKNSKAPSGNYTNTHESGKTYSGVGDKKRMNQSAERIAKNNTDPVKSQKYQSAKNKREAYLKENTDIKDNGGAGNNDRNYNKINSPGKKIAEQNQ